MPGMCCGNILIKVGYWFYVNTRFGRWYFNRSLNQIQSTYPLGHSAQMNMEYGDFHVSLVPYSKDNYGYIIWRESNRNCIIIDPGYFPPFATLLTTHQLCLHTVLITHKHFDHCGSIDAIKALYPHVKIYAHEKEHIKSCTNPLKEQINTFEVCGDILDPNSVCTSNDFIHPIHVKAYHTPGHTKGHLIYTITTNDENSLLESNKLLVFSGDSIFLGSIGAMFEGSVKENIQSLEFFIGEMILLDQSTDDILIFPGHEYSLDSLQFIVYNCTPFNSYARKKMSWADEQRNWMLPTIPSTLFEELSYSPYLRVAMATAPGKKRHAMYKLANDEKDVYYLPNIIEVIHELLLTEKFIKRTISQDIKNILGLKELLFNDIFSEKKKILLRCEKCSPEIFLRKPNGSTLPLKCIDSNSPSDEIIEN